MDTLARRTASRAAAAVVALVAALAVLVGFSTDVLARDDTPAPAAVRTWR